jgi:hypothetical protein
VVERITEMPGTACAGCHATIINPLGFATESFDALGRVRSEQRLFDDAGKEVGRVPVDTRSRRRWCRATRRRPSGACDLMRLIAAAARPTPASPATTSASPSRAGRTCSADGCLLERLRQLLVKHRSWRGAARGRPVPEFQQRYDSDEEDPHPPPGPAWQRRRSRSGCPSSPRWPRGPSPPIRAGAPAALRGLHHRARRHRRANMFPDPALLTQKTDLFQRHAIASGALKTRLEGATPCCRRCCAARHRADRSAGGQDERAARAGHPFYIGHHTGGHLGNYARNDGNGGDGKIAQASPLPTIDQVMAWSPHFYPDLSASRSGPSLTGSRGGLCWNWSNPAPAPAPSRRCGPSRARSAVQPHLRSAAHPGPSTRASRSSIG